MNSEIDPSETLPWPHANAAALAYVEAHKLSPEPWDSLREQISAVPEPPTFALHAVRVLQGFWPQYADACRAALAKAVAAPSEVANDEMMLHVYAGYLLAEHCDPHCFEIAQQLVALSSDECDELIGEDWPVTMEPWLASFCAEHEARCEWLIERARDARLSNSMRHCIVSALVRCVNAGTFPAARLYALIFELIDTVVTRLDSVSDDPVPDDDDDYMDDRALIALLICVFDEFDLDDREATIARIKPYFVAGVVDTQVIDWDYLEKGGLQTGTRRPALSGSTDDEFGWWACFAAESVGSRWLRDDDQLDPEHYALRTDPGYLEAFEAELPFVRDTPKVGRNDPCTCGSGKKFKKCCGA